ncbi:murein hydrolase activator EnvC family protein [Chondromyces crocatus]|uniref:Exported peptidase n=1 Tax=Chondromyces crocatus TaxID=52 RepID=A0A0K1E6Y8_CHOCO|nr:peptidoglycan DD-metalloendopeptidase family protein [Chondromyces crocatus]AKT36609.1 exported peptidase [Chondromyces crocatus]
MRAAIHAALFLAAALTGTSASDAQSGASTTHGVSKASMLGENDLDRLLARFDAEEKALKAELLATGPQLEVVRHRMSARGRAYYRGLRAGFLPVGGGFDALVDHAARLERLRRSLERDLAREQELTQHGVTLEARLVRLRAERAPLDVQREAMNRARFALAQEEDRRAAFSRAFETSVRPDHVAVYGADLGPTDLDERAGFRSLKGRLPLPLTGRVEVRQISRPGSSLPGLSFSAASSGQVRSVAAGRVAFADMYADYGLTVILDHGDHHYSLYSGLSSADVRVSEQLAAGAQVGTVKGDPDGGKLYFELRHRAEVIHPGAWFGL